MTIQLTSALRAWGTPGFNDTLKHEVEGLDYAQLPLYQALSVGSHVLEGTLDAMVINASGAPGVIQAKVGIFYRSILTGCACADDPTPVNENNEYCVVRFDIDAATGEAEVQLLDE
ncbi:MAG: hypothetical protein IT489_05290 [Gammaproteobacteria bacterium]|nr:hypothetical protein [Gammaproteobacteria bacterium]